MDPNRIVCFLFLLVGTVNCISRIGISNNGYSNVVVAIHPQIKAAEGEPLIAKIKDLFTSGSAALYTATRQRAYFKDVTILVPKDWPRRSDYKVAEFEVYTQADVQIKEASSKYGNRPYSVQPLPCGQSAEYIHLTPNYLRYLNDNSTRLYGHPGKTLVHEWAHLRYGVFDEYGEDGVKAFPHFYVDPETDTVQPTACTNAPLIGRRRNLKEQRECNSQSPTSLPEKDCVFLPDVTRNGKVTSSIGSYHFLPNAFTFCDDSDEFKHNKFAPTRHNRLCKGRSTWNVITSHQDFANSNAARNISNTIPNFKIVQEEEATYSLVLDISSSMNSPSGHTKIAMLYEAASRFVKEEVKIGTAVGVVTFSNSATLVSPAVRITSDSVRQQIINQIPKTASGYTCIGCGLRQAMNDLRRFRGGANGGIIVLLSDGEENRSPYIRDVQQEVVNSNIRVITIAFTAAASKNMEDLAIATGGKSFFVPLNAGVIKLDAAFHEAATMQATEVDVVAKISENRFKDRTDSFEATFQIDSTIGRETSVSFLYNDRNDIVNIVISGPGVSSSLQATPSGGIKIEQNQNLKQILFVFPLLQAGTYKYVISRRGSRSQDITVNVLSKARVKGDEPIAVKCTIHNIENRDPPRYLITATVKKGENPVINAKVIAKVDRPNNYPSVTLELFDVGYNGDLVRDDGIYSKYFTQISGAGRYTVQANVVSDVKTAIIETGFTGSSSLEILTEDTQLPPTVEVPTGDFQRVADAGSIQVTQNINAETNDLYPPSQTNDLSVVSISDDYQQIVLQWSAPGDDLDNGQASAYEMKYTMNFDMLQNSFHGAPYNITAPKPAGQIETLAARFTGFGPGITYYAALRTKDESGKWSEISNIVEIRAAK